jgi:parvulin-like peptidyl-prolyl isomerase
LLLGHWIILMVLVAWASPRVIAATNQPPGAPKPASVAGLFDDPVIARAKGVEIKLSQLEAGMAAYRARLAEQKQALPEVQRPLIERQMLEELLVTKILALQAKPEDMEKAKQSTQRIITAYMTNAGSEEALRRQLKLRDTTLEKFTLELLEQDTARAVMDRELRPKINISDANVQDFYANGVDSFVKIMQSELLRLVTATNTTPAMLAATKARIDDLKNANLAKLQFPERVRVTHVLFSTLDRDAEQELPEAQKKAKLALAQSVLAKARAGENFTNLVQKYSEDRNLPETHGEYVLAKDEPYALEFKSAAFSLTNNQISDIVTTVFGYHIIKQLERIPPKKIEYEKVAADIRKSLEDQEFEQRIPDFFAQVKKEAQAEIVDPKYRFNDTARDLVKPGN